jgi:DNA polymerase III subunit epsilon
MEDFLFIDTETTGLDPKKNGMIEVACVRVTPDAKTILDEYEAKIILERTRYRVDSQAMAVNGYTDELWKDALPLGTVLIELAKRITKRVSLAGHNVHFDINFITESFLRDERNPPQMDYHCTDTMSLASPLKTKGLVPNIKLVTLTKHFGIEHKAHSALADAKASLELYRRIIEFFPPQNRLCATP